MKYVSRKGIVLCEIAGQYALVSAQHLREEVPYAIAVNDTCAFCWKCLEEGADEEELCRKLCEEFEADDVNDVRRDVESLLSQLKEHKYIQEVSDEKNI